MKVSWIIRFFLFFSFIAFIIGSIYFFVNQTQRSSQSEKITTVKYMDLEQKISIAGSIEPEKKAIITAPFDGYVHKLYVKIGDQVKKNAPIVSVTETLQFYGPIYPIKAPFDGTVVQSVKKEGELVRKNNLEQYLVRIDKLDTLYVEFDVPELYRLQIKPGQSAIVKIAAILNKQYKGMVESVSLAAKHQVNWRENDNAEFLSKVQILDIDNNIKPGMSAIIDIVTLKKEQVLALPHEFIFREKDSFFVIMQNDQKKVITVGIQNEFYSEITDGLRAGNKVKQIDYFKHSSQL